MFIDTKIARSLEGLLDPHITKSFKSFIQLQINGINEELAECDKELDIYRSQGELRAWKALLDIDETIKQLVIEGIEDDRLEELRKLHDNGRG